MIHNNNNNNNNNNINDNNINNIKLNNHDTYVYYIDSLFESEQIVKLSPVLCDKSNVIYSSLSTNLFTNGIKDGIFEVNRFFRINKNEDITNSTFIATIITSKGVLTFNFSGFLLTQNLLFVKGQTFTSFATYKSGDYANYINVRISISFSDDLFRVITISY